MKFIDSHHHLWDLDKLDYGWLKDIGSPKPFGDPTPIQRPYLAPEFIRQAGPDCLGSVHLQCDPGLPDPVAETAWLSQVSQLENKPNAIVGFVDLTSAEREKTLDRHQEFDLFRGTRQIIANNPERPDLSFRKDNLLDHPDFILGLQSLSDRGLSFDLQLYPQQMRQAAQVLGQLPDLAVIIDHAGSPYDQSANGLATWRQGLAHLAAQPQVSIKLCGFGMYDARWSADTCQSIFDACLELFGPKRVMLGSNFPVDSLMQTYDYLRHQWASWLAHLNSEDQEAIAWRTAAQIYRIKL